MRCKLKVSQPACSLLFSQSRTGLIQSDSPHVIGMPSVYQTCHFFICFITAISYVSRVSVARIYYYLTSPKGNKKLINYLKTYKKKMLNT